MSEQVVKRYDISGFGGGMVESADGAWYHMDDFDALHAEAEALKRKVTELTNQRDAILLQARCWAGEAKAQQAITKAVGEALGGVPNWGPIAAGVEALRAENGRLNAELSGALTGIATESQAADHYRAELEAARGLLETLRTLPDAALFKSEIDALLTATPAPEVPDHFRGVTQMVEQGERQEAVHWRAVLSPAEVPMQLNVHEHVAGFTDRRKAEEWIAARLDMDGWHYTLEALYPRPQPGPDARGLVEALEAVHERFGPCRGEFIFSKRHALDKVAAALAAHRQAQRKGDSHDT